jgi:lipid-A-disaccharide synthase
MALIPFVSLVSILARKEILPERLQERCIPKRIAQELKCVAQSGIMPEQRQQCLEALEMLRGPGRAQAHDAAAVVVLSYGLANNMGIPRPGEE